MIRLTNATTDLLRVTPSSTNAVKAVVQYSDKTASAYTGGNQATSIAAASITTICATPAASTVRDIDHVQLYCADANTLTVGQTISGTEYILLVVTMAAGDTLEYTHGKGWQTLDSNGTLKTLSFPLSAALGGTGIANNAASTITVSGNYNTTFVAGAATTQTLPTTSATLARTDAGQTFTGVQVMTSPSITTSLVTGSTTFALINTTAETIYFAGAATTLNIGNASGTNTVLGATTFSQAGVFSSTLAVNGSSLTTTATTFNLLAGATTSLVIGGGASSVTSFAGTLEATGTTAGVTMAGGLYVAKAVIAAGNVTVNSTGQAEFIPNAATGNAARITFKINGTRTAAWSSDAASELKLLDAAGSTLANFTSTGLSVTGTLGVTGALTTNGGLQTFGANDSGGAGYRLVLVPNA